MKINNQYPATCETTAPELNHNAPRRKRSMEQEQRGKNSQDIAQMGKKECI